jgi:hypothetical protein
MTRKTVRKHVNKIFKVFYCLRKYLLIRYKYIVEFGFYYYNFNREITRQRNLDKLLNKSSNMSKFDHQQIHRNSGLKLENLFFSFIIILIGINISLLTLILDNMLHIFSHKNSCSLILAIVRSKTIRLNKPKWMNCFKKPKVLSRITPIKFNLFYFEVKV